LKLGEVLFGFNGVVVWLAVVAAVVRLTWGRGDRDSWFLVAWLLLEVAGYFALSPFAAVRRLLGLCVVVPLIAGRLAGQMLPGRGRSAVRGAAMYGAALAGLYGAIDWYDAWAQQAAAEGAARRIAATAPGARAFFVGHWGFQFYAERAGMIALRPSPSEKAEPEPQRLQPGDWIAVPDGLPNGVYRQEFKLAPDDYEEHAAPDVIVPRWLPLRTVMCYYCGLTPLERFEGPRLRVVFYRIKRPAIPVTPP
jgi:hypothetical protein